MNVAKVPELVLTKREKQIRSRWETLFFWRTGVILVLLLGCVFSISLIGTSVATGAGAEIAAVGIILFAMVITYFCFLERHALREFGSKFLIFDLFLGLSPIFSPNHFFSLLSNSTPPQTVFFLLLFSPIFALQCAFTIFSVELLFLNKDVQKRNEKEEENSIQ